MFLFSRRGGRRAPLFLPLSSSLLVSLVACSTPPTAGSPDDGVGGTGGSSAANGGLSTTPTGGVSAAGGAPATGGSRAAGGSSGGSASGTSGGDGGSGSAPPTGGSGNATSSGGSDATGGAPPSGFAQLERLGRGAVAVTGPAGTLLSWRLLGQEPSDLGFNVYKDGAKVTPAPVTTSTNFLDKTGSPSSVYTVRAVLDGVEQAESPPAVALPSGYMEIATEAPPNGSNADGPYSYTSSDGSVGDVDGDGEYELIVKWDPNNAKDNSQSGYTGNVFIDAYEFSGERLWRIDLGVNIRAGAHYTQFIVYDLDGDGKAEVALKTAPGTRDSTGEALKLGPAATADHGADYRNSSGYILTGPEFLTVFDGQTGFERATVPFQVARGEVGEWGDTYGNRVDRFLGAVAFLNESGRPSLVMGRGMYTRTTFSAWAFDGNELTLQFISDNASNGPYAGKGSHGISVANVDGDPMQEIIGGSATFDHDGTPVCAVPFYGHGDALHVSDLIPSRPGLEVFMPFEADQVPQYGMRDAGSCELLWVGPDTPTGGEGPGRGVAGDVDPTRPGAEAWVSGGQLMDGATGEKVAAKPRFDNFLVWWDGDLSRELLDGNTIRQYDGEGSDLTAEGCASNNGSKSTPTLSADLFGDWREEVVFRCGSSIRIYSTPQETQHRIYTLMHDPQYRVAISWQNVEYNQPPHPSFHIGEGMAPAPVPDIKFP